MLWEIQLACYEGGGPSLEASPILEDYSEATVVADVQETVSLVEGLVSLPSVNEVVEIEDS